MSLSRCALRCAALAARSASEGQGAAAAGGMTGVAAGSTGGANAVTSGASGAGVIIAGGTGVASEPAAAHSCLLTYGLLGDAKEGSVMMRSARTFNSLSCKRIPFAASDPAPSSAAGSFNFGGTPARGIDVKPAANGGGAGAATTASEALARGSIVTKRVSSAACRGKRTVSGADLNPAAGGSGGAASSTGSHGISSICRRRSSSNWRDKAMACSSSASSHRITAADAA
mmetsp:Transcript_134952/g.234631  ORF Transcript_134952/g.234631 Transcript_134952/m.234631 type:complete len:229 (+) Transcript_134952:454-1140(+)